MCLYPFKINIVGKKGRFVHDHYSYHISYLVVYYYYFILVIIDCLKSTTHRRQQIFGIFPGDTVSVLQLSSVVAGFGGFWSSLCS